jgi:hypothetical protein
VFGVFRRFFADLIEGDTVALVSAGVIAGVALLLCLIWWKIARDLRREDEQRKQRYGRGKKN